MIVFKKQCCKSFYCHIYFLNFTQTFWDNNFWFLVSISDSVTETISSGETKGSHLVKCLIFFDMTHKELICMLRGLPALGSSYKSGTLGHDAAGPAVHEGLAKENTFCSPWSRRWNVHFSTRKEFMNWPPRKWSTWRILAAVESGCH